MHYHQYGKSIGGSTRVFERQTIADQIRIADNALARLRRRRFRRLALRVLAWPAHALVGAIEGQAGCRHTRGYGGAIGGRGGLGAVAAGVG